MDETSIALVADAFAAAEASGGIAEPAVLPATLDEAEAIQDAFLRRRGRPVAAWKLGATNRASIATLGLPQGFAGAIAAGNLWPSGGILPPGTLRQRGVEVEIAFRIGRTLSAEAAPWTAAVLRDAIASVHAALEIPQARMARIGEYGPLTLVADNGAAGHAVIGEGIADWDPAAIAGAAAELQVDGSRVASGSAAEVIAGPFESLLALARRLQVRGYDLVEGQVVLTGSLTPYFLVSEGVGVHAMIAGIGEVGAFIG